MKMMKQDRQHLLLHEPNMYKSFVMLALPLFAVNLLASMNDLIDTYFVGNMPNSVAAQSGMSVSWPFMNILMAFNMGIAVAGVAVIVDRSGGDAKFDVPFQSALKLDLPTFDPAACPLCAKKLPIDRPGSK